MGSAKCLDHERVEERREPRRVPHEEGDHGVTRRSADDGGQPRVGPCRECGSWGSEARQAGPLKGMTGGRRAPLLYTGKHAESELKPSSIPVRRRSAWHGILKHADHPLIRSDAQVIANRGRDAERPELGLAYRLRAGRGGAGSRSHEIGDQEHWHGEPGRFHGQRLQERPRKQGGRSAVAVATEGHWLERHVRVNGLIGPRGVARALPCFLPDR